MLDWSYRKRLAADLPKWLDAGWVTADNAAAILGSVTGAGGRRPAFGFSAILGTLGALLLGLGVIAFVGSNWDHLPRIFRLGLIIAAMMVAYAAAFSFDRRQLRIFAEAGLLAGGLVYAGGIALVGQTYHLAGDFEGAVLLFEVGILGAALFTGSPTLTVLGIIGAAYWAKLGIFDARITFHWQSLVAIGVGVLVTTVQNSRYGRIVAILALMFWLVMTIAGFGDAKDWSFAGGLALYSAVALALWAAGAALASITSVPRVAALGEAILWPGLFAVLVSLGVLQLADTAAGNESTLLITSAITLALAAACAAFALVRKYLTVTDVVIVIGLGAGAIAFAVFLPTDDLMARVAGGVIVVAAALWAVSLGQTGTHPIGKTIGLFAFGVEVIYLYVRTLGTLLDTALAFLIGGALFIGLSFVLFRIDRRLAKRAAEPKPAEGVAP
jgi:uncharacterized membrane protein